MRSAQWQDQHQGRGRPTWQPRSNRLWLWIAVASLLAGGIAGPPAYIPGGTAPSDALFAQENAAKQPEGAAEKAPAAGEHAVAYRFDVPLPIAGKSVVRRVEQVLRKLPKNGPRPVLVFEFMPA